MKKGFGLLEVLIAAVVLGFLIIGLNNLQKGNRESILRVRARDAANTIAQDLIDSLAALGPASVQSGNYACECTTNENCNEKNYLCKKRDFEGGAGKVEIPYSIKLCVNDNSSQAADEQTDYMKALSTSGSSFSVKHQFAKQIDVTVNWKFKNSSQSINMSTVIR